MYTPHCMVALMFPLSMCTFCYKILRSNPMFLMIYIHMVGTTHHWPGFILLTWWILPVLSLCMRFLQCLVSMYWTCLRWCLRWCVQILGTCIFPIHTLLKLLRCLMFLLLWLFLWVVVMLLFILLWIYPLPLQGVPIFLYILHIYILDCLQRYLLEIHEI